MWSVDKQIGKVNIWRAQSPGQKRGNNTRSSRGDLFILADGGLPCLSTLSHLGSKLQLFNQIVCWFSRPFLSRGSPSFLPTSHPRPTWCVLVCKRGWSWTDQQIASTPYPTCFAIGMPDITNMKTYENNVIIHYVTMSYLSLPQQLH